MNLTIRQAKIEDADKITQAERKIAKNPGYFCSLPSELMEQNIEKTISYLLQNKERGVYLIAELDGSVVGHAFLESVNLKSLQHVAELNIAIHEGWQEQGIGKALMKALIDWAKNSETIEKIELNVRSSNTRAIALYKKLGFQEEGRLKKKIKIQDGYIDDLIMALQVKEPPSVKNEVILRPLIKEDIPLLAKTFCAPWTTVQEILEKWQRYYVEQQNAARDILIMERQNQLLGYGSLLMSSEYYAFKEASVPEICDVWIQEDMQNRGLGRMLISHLENMAAKKGYQKVGIGVGLYRDYGPAQILYAKLGYIPDGNGITYKTISIIPGKPYPIDDDLILWLIKSLE